MIIKDLTPHVFLTPYVLDTFGNSVSLTNPEGNKTEYLDFDARGFAAKMKDSRGNTSTMSYNPLGWKLSDTNALGHTSTREIAGSGLLISYF